MLLFVCMKESALLFGISLQGHVFNVEKEERRGRKEARQTSFIALSYDLITVNERNEDQRHKKELNLQTTEHCDVLRVYFSRSKS